MDVKVTVRNAEMSKEEIDAYIIHGVQQYPHRDIAEMIVTADGEFVDLEYKFKSVPPFERIRRITGYLVGTTDRWNDGKKAEEKDRVKHSVTI